MAFQCQSCYKKEQKREAKKKGKKVDSDDWSWRLKSYGPCEDCRKTKVCVDR